MADETTHTCIQVEKIATLTARLDAQSDADNRIEKELKDLATEVRANHESNNGEFRELSKGFVKLEGLLKSQSEKIDNININIQEHNEKLDKLTTRVDEVEKTVKVNTKDIEELKTDKGNHEIRLTSVEKNMIKIAAIVGAVLFLIQLVGSMSSCQEVKSAVRQMFTEEQQARPTTNVMIEQKN